jgi:cellulose synthase/poly-beta-1,6-N-acetylglucosamine synthase-like glycosyltransferase
LILEFLFISSFFLIIYSYILYPILIKIISIYKRKREIIPTYAFSKSVSIIISAYNEDKIIESRIKNISEADFDFDNLEVLVGSDGSNDETVKILENLKKDYEWLKIFDYPQRRGKAEVLNDLISEAKNEVLIFTDANTVFEKNNINQLASSFYIENIGGVCGILNLTNEKYKSSGSSDEVSYWRYETFIKQAEGDCNVLIGSNGGNYAIRRSLYSPIPIDKPVTDDLYITLNILSKNHKFIFNNRAIASEEVSPRLMDEFRRKIRFASTNYQSLVLLHKLLFSRNFLLSFSLWSHKVIRWIVPILLLIMFLSNLFLVINSDSAFYFYSFIIQLFLLIMVLTGFIFSFTKIRLPVISLFYFFAISNISMLIGFAKFLQKKHTSYWQSTPR